MVLKNCLIDLHWMFNHTTSSCHSHCIQYWQKNKAAAVAMWKLMTFLLQGLQFWCSSPSLYIDGAVLLLLFARVKKRVKLSNLNSDWSPSVAALPWISIFYYTLNFTFLLQQAESNFNIIFQTNDPHKYAQIVGNLSKRQTSQEDEKPVRTVSYWSLNK